MALIINKADEFKMQGLDQLRAKREGILNNIAALELDLEKAYLALADIDELEAAVKAEFQPTIDKVEAIKMEIIEAELKAQEEIELLKQTELDKEIDFFVEGDSIKEI